MTTISSEPSVEKREEDIQNLEKRVESVERHLCDAVNREEFLEQTKGTTNLAKQLDELVKRYEEVEKENEDIKDVVAKYEEFESFLDKEFKDKPFVSTTEKTAILLSAFSEFKHMAVQLAEVEQLKSVALDHNPIRDLTKTDSILVKAELDTQSLLLDTLHFKQQLDDFLTNYNDYVMLFIFFFQTNKIYFYVFYVYSDRNNSIPITRKPFFCCFFKGILNGKVFFVLVCQCKYFLFVDNMSAFTTENETVLYSNNKKLVKVFSLQNLAYFSPEKKKKAKISEKVGQT
ncbi:hypothetical protein RFI_05034 [Reticulomyxa filosa]|uniref:Uncharacterized protein n=1 Tax=Reticulomyxa filosa TaxID=46433 RepID=X6P1E5_RETFI|nr:hypothetical protein RFI_05034 [Reticulomyxa filosa]|eukprot:ETO32081.1 hypothetical protein RFI_05034 [Reticulomyxa filosa]